MKNPYFLIKIAGILFAMSLFLSSCGIFEKDEYDESKVYKAIEYNDVLIEEEIKVIEKINNLDDAVNDFDYKKIKTELEEAKNQLNLSIKAVKKIKAFYGDSSFKDETISFFKCFNDLLDNEYTQILAINENKEERFSDENRKKYRELSDSIDEKYEAGFDKFVAVQNAFADKFGFTIKE